MKRLIFVSLVVMLALVLGACTPATPLAPGETGEPVAGQTLIFAHTADAGTLDPARETSANNQKVEHHRIKRSGRLAHETAP